MSLGELADVASLLGLMLTIWLAWRAKNAAEQASDAAQKVQHRLAIFDTLADVSSAIAALNELKTLQRLGAWDLVLERYGVLRRQLVRISRTTLIEGHTAELSRAISHLGIIEEQVELARVNGAYEQLDSIEFNSILANQIDALEGVMMVVKRVGA